MKSYHMLSNVDMFATPLDGKTLQILSLKYSDEDNNVKGSCIFTDDSGLNLKLMSTIQITDYSGESDPASFTLYHCYVYGIHRLVDGEREYLFTAKIIG